MSQIKSNIKEDKNFDLREDHHKDLLRKINVTKRITQNIFLYLPWFLEKENDGSLTKQL